MLTIKKDYKIPYIPRIIPAGTTMEHLGYFTKKEDKGMIKVKILKVEELEDKKLLATKGHYKLVEPEQVYGIDESLLTKN